MTEMTLNGTDIMTYMARLLEYSVSGTAVENNTSAASSRLSMPELYSSTLAPRTLTITLTFFPTQLGSDSRKTSIPERLTRATENITRFESDIIGKTVEIGLPDGYLYTALVTNIAAATFDGTGEHDIVYTFSAIRHLNVENISVKPNGNLICKSNTDTACKIIFTVPSHFADVEICGVKISNLDADIEYVIDSVNGIITANGENKFLDTEFIDFPYLQAGSNIISCSTKRADITVVYTPIFA
jgi:hypothetical protein